MPRQKKSSPVLPTPKSRERFNQELQSLAEQLADRCVESMWGVTEAFTVDHAVDALYKALMSTVHKPKPTDDEDQVAGLRMCAHEDAGLLIGFALGRKMAGAR